MLTDEDIQKNKQQIIHLLESIPERENFGQLMEFLNRSGYYYLYGSFRHHTYKGGLAQHSLEVMNYALENNKSCKKESIILSALLHDICKTKYPFPEGVEFHGHGTKSAAIIRDFIKYPLSDDEYNAIRFHMGSRCMIHDEDEAQKYEIARQSELWKLVHEGDCISAGDYPRMMHKPVGKIISLLKL